MNIKKLSAALLAAAIMATSGSAAVRSVAADSSDIVMVSLREYKTQLTINDKTYSELADGVTIGDILDGMVYRGNQTDKDGNSFTDGAPVTLPADATVVWVGNNQYSIYDRDTKVRLSSYGANDIIIGSGRQLDPNNIIYHVYADITYVTYDIDWENSDIKLYSISEDGSEKPLDYEVKSKNNTSLDLNVQKKETNDRVMVDVSGLKMKLSNGAAMPEYTIKLYDWLSDKELLPDEDGRIFVKPSSRFYCVLLAKDGSPLPGADSYYSERVSVNYPRIYIQGYLDYSYIYTSDFTSQEGTNSITYEYTKKLSPGTLAKDLKFEIRSFYNNAGKYFKSNDDVLKAVKGNRTDYASAADDEDITDDLFRYYGGVDGDYVNGQEFTIFLKGDSENVKPFLDTEDAKEYIVHIKITAVEQRLYTDLVYESGAVGENVSSGYYRYSEVKSSNGFSRTDYINVPDSMRDSSVGYYISKLQREYDDLNLKDKVTKAVKGKFTSSESAVDAEEISIVDLFDSSKGYVSDFSTENGEDITIFLDAAGDSPANALCADENATEYVINIHIDKYIYTPIPEPEPEPEFVDTDDSKLPPDIKNTNFKVLSVSDEGYNVIKTSLGLHTDSEATYFDTYGKYGMQTIFVFDDENGGTIDLSKIRLNVKKDADVRVFLIEDGKATYVNLDEETQDFSDGKVKHYATAKRGEGNKYYKQGNYYVTVKKGNNGSGSGLFVEGPSDQNGQQGGTRTIFFDSYYGKAYHDIVIANLGTSPLTNLTAILSDAKNIKLNGFWDLNGEYQLAPTTVSVTGTGMSKVTRVENMAKIRIEPETDENGRPKKGDIEGTLKISADGQTYTIKLSGKIKDPEILTSELGAAVKYVPYSSIISVDTIHQWLTTKFEVIGDLPEWLTLNETNGELYGIPLETGRFSFEIQATTSWDGHEDDYSSSVSYKWLTLEVKENTDENVFNESDEGYTIKTSIGEAENQFDFVLSENEMADDQVFTSNGEYGDFIDFWLNGEKLIEGTDYTSEEGSTKITIKSQTISGLPKDKANTIAAEFRIDGKLENDLKKTAQNFTIKTNDKPDTSPDDNPDGSGDSDNSSDNNTSDSTSTPDTSDNTSTPDTSDNTNTSSTSDNIGSSSGTSDNTGDSTPTEGDIVFKPVPVNGDMADIINGMTIVAPIGVMSKDALLIVEPDGSISADKGTALDIAFTLNGEKVQPSGSMTVRIPIPDDLKSVSTLYVYHITDGKYDFVDSWIDGDYVCFKASGFSTYVVSGKKLDSSGNELTADAPGTSENPITGIGMSATGMLISGAALTIILLNRKKR